MFDLMARGSESGFLRYAYADSPVGRLLVAMSDKGVVDIILGSSNAELLASAVRRFPGMGLVPDRGVHADWVSTVVGRVARPEVHVLVPLEFAFGGERRAAV
jgi:hypothetical protein